jgi:hypothetical protein
LSSTLPLALGRLQGQGEIRRVPIEGRLDRQRFRYGRWRPNPLAKVSLSDDEVALELARRFFRWAGPATVAQLAWWAALTMKAARAAAAQLPLSPLQEGDERLLLTDDLDALRAAKSPTEPAISFVGILDNITHPRRDASALLADEDAKVSLTPGNAGKAGSTVLDLEYHAIIDRGRLIGLWDYDGMKNQLLWSTFHKAHKSVADAAQAVEKFVRDQLGDLRAFSLDSPESRGERLSALKEAKWGAR